jgi:hypothetical protein
MYIFCGVPKQFFLPELSTTFKNVPSLTKSSFPTDSKVYKLTFVGISSESALINGKPEVEDIFMNVKQQLNVIETHFPED